MILLFYHKSPSNRHIQSFSKFLKIRDIEIGNNQHSIGNLVCDFLPRRLQVNRSLIYQHQHHTGETSYSWPPPQNHNVSKIRFAEPYRTRAWNYDTKIQTGTRLRNIVINYCDRGPGETRVYDVQLSFDEQSAGNEKTGNASHEWEEVGRCRHAVVIVADKCNRRHAIYG